MANTEAYPPGSPGTRRRPMVTTIESPRKTPEFWRPGKNRGFSLEKVSVFQWTWLCFVWLLLLFFFSGEKLQQGQACWSTKSHKNWCLFKFVRSDCYQTCRPHIIKRLLHQQKESDAWANLANWSHETYWTFPASKKLELNPKSNKTLKASRLLTSESGFTFPKKTDENQKTQPWALLTPKKNEFGPKIPFFGRRSRSFLLQALLSQSRCCCTQPRGWKNLHPRCFRVLGADLGTFFGVGGVGLGTWPLSHKNLLGLGTWGFRVVL